MELPQPVRLCCIYQVTRFHFDYADERRDEFLLFGRIQYLPKDFQMVSLRRNLQIDVKRWGGIQEHPLGQWTAAERYCGDLPPVIEDQAGDLLDDRLPADFLAIFR